jgi:hypothetical protein
MEKFSVLDTLMEMFSGTGYTDGKVLDTLMEKSRVLDTLLGKFSGTGYTDGKVLGYWIH